MAAETAPSSPRFRPGRTTLARIGVIAVVLALIGLAAQQRPIAAAPSVPQPTSPSILPASVGVGIASHAAVELSFAAPMDVASFASSLDVAPSTQVRTAWSTDGRRVQITPATRWQTEERYLLTVPASTRLANGSVLGAPMRYTFTTQTAPTVTSFAIERVGPDAAAERLSVEAGLADQAAPAPADTAADASARTAIRIGFGASVNHAEVERGFLISPAVAGQFSWEGTALIFTPEERLDAGVRYSVSILGAHDLQGNPIGGDTSFSFTTAAAARVVKIVPADGASGVSSPTIQLWFSSAVDTAATQAAFRLVDTTRNASVAGAFTWGAGDTRLTFKASAALAAGHHFQVRITSGAEDVDGNAIAATFDFTTKAPPAPVRTAAPVIVAPAPSGSVQAYALALINASRNAYGFAPLRLDAALTAVASAHALDQIRYDYFSHYSRDGSSFHDRLDAAGISYSHAGENQCLDYGSITHALSWCHSIMMAEPYPGYWNHIANILDPRFTRVGFGYGRAADGKLIMTWDFAG